MQTNPQTRWGLRLATLCVWVLAAASVVYWGLLIRSPAGGPVAAMVPSVSAAPVDPARLARLLGAMDGPAAVVNVVSAASRFALVGVVAGASGSGAALIAVDGKPARSYRVGAAVDTAYVLKSVGPRMAVLAAALDAPAAVTLEMASARPSAMLPGVPPVRFTSPPPPAQPPALVPNSPAIQQDGAPGAGPGVAPAGTGRGADGRRPRPILGGRNSTGTEPFEQQAAAAQ